MLGFECLAYLGMAKNETGRISAIEAWDDVFTFSGVCRSWREASINYLNFIKPKIDLMPILGFSDRKLNVDGFLSYLAEDDWFRSATTIYVPCCRVETLFYRNVKTICPAMTKLMHKTWLMVNGNVVYFIEGHGRHQCYRVYKQ